MSAQSLVVRDGNAMVRALQVDSGSNGYIPNHSLVSTAETANSLLYIPNPGAGEQGWTFGDTSGTGSNVFSVASANTARKGIIIHNNSANGQCYILLGSGNFGSNPDQSKAPKNYSFLLDSGATYFGDTLTCAVAHSVYVVSASVITTADAMTVCVSQIY